jgi:hypothetical protein
MKKMATEFAEDDTLQALLARLGLIGKVRTPPTSALCGPTTDHRLTD